MKPEIFSAVYVVRRVQGACSAEQFSALKIFSGVSLEDGCGEIERHSEVEAVVMRATGRGDRAQMSPVQLAAVECIGYRAKTGCQVRIEGFRNRLRQNKRSRMDIFSV